MTPCYVSGKGMCATEITWSFKTSVIRALETTGSGYDTRYNYYRQQFPDMQTEQLSRMICDPVEYYDKDWPAYRSLNKRTMSKEEMTTRFMLERDMRFQQEAQMAIYCFDEAGFGSGINVMRFLQAKKPVLGFMNEQNKHKSLNVSNVLQLKAQYPNLIHLVEYLSLDDISKQVLQWMEEMSNTHEMVKLQLVTE